MKEFFMKNGAKRAFAAGFAALIAVSPVLASGKSDKSDEVKLVRVGVTSDDPRIWDAVQEELDAKGKKIKIQSVFFDGGASINKATADGDLDLNAFQHYAFFYQNSESQKVDKLVTPVAETLIVPLNLFSNQAKKYRTPAELPNGASVIVPDDPTNQGRALYVLEQAGLIKVRPEAGFNGQLKDVISNPKNLKFVEIYGAQIPRALPDVDAAIINVYAAVNAGIDVKADAIFALPVDPSNAALKPFFNIIVARTADKDSPWVKDIVAAYQTKRVADAIISVYKAAAVPVFKY
jgi:D-methionine transport system substrate-binding protein